LSATVDYDAVAREIRQLAAERPRRLIESLAGEIAQAVLVRPLVCGVLVTIRKRILPGVDDVAVRIHRAK
jgi:dihydroneopterin aldolase